MRKLLLALLIVLALVSNVFAVGTATVTGFDTMRVVGQPTRVILTITWTDDTAGTTLAVNPATYGITGWYLYSAETDPGATAPTALYDITLVDANAVDIAGGTLMNRSATVTELVNVGSASHGFPVIRGNFTFTLSGNAVNNATGIVILTFVAN
jgi:hypothetical protein